MENYKVLKIIGYYFHLKCFQSAEMNGYKFANTVSRLSSATWMWDTWTSRNWDTVYVVYIRGGFIFVNFASQSSRKFPLQFMSIYSNENIRKIVKLTPCKFPHLVQNRENSVRKIYGIYTVQ